MHYPAQTSSRHSALGHRPPVSSSAGKGHGAVSSTRVANGSKITADQEISAHPKSDKVKQEVEPDKAWARLLKPPTPHPVIEAACAARDFSDAQKTRVKLEREATKKTDHSDTQPSKLRQEADEAIEKETKLFHNLKVSA